MEDEQKKLINDHEENMKRYKNEMTKKFIKEKKELQEKINEENKRHADLVNKGFQKEANQLLARLQGMQNNLNQKVIKINKSDKYFLFRTRKGAGWWRSLRRGWRGSCRLRRRGSGR